MRMKRHSDVTISFNLSFIIFNRLGIPNPQIKQTEKLKNQ